MQEQVSTCLVVVDVQWPHKTCALVSAFNVYHGRQLLVPTELHWMGAHRYQIACTAEPSALDLLDEVPHGGTFSKLASNHAKGTTTGDPASVALLPLSHLICANRWYFNQRRDTASRRARVVLAALLFALEGRSFDEFYRAYGHRPASVLSDADGKELQRAESWWLRQMLEARFLRETTLPTPPQPCHDADRHPRPTTERSDFAVLCTKLTNVACVGTPWSLGPTATQLRFGHAFAAPTATTARTEARVGEGHGMDMVTRGHVCRFCTYAREDPSCELCDDHRGERRPLRYFPCVCE